MKNVGFLSRYPRDLITGGAETQADEYILGLKKRGYNAKFINGQPTKDLDVIHFVGLSVDFSYIAKAAKSAGIKVITSPNFLYSTGKSVAAQILSRLPFASTTIPYKYAEQLHYSDIVIVNSEYEKQHIRRVFGENKLVTIYNGAHPKEKLQQKQIHSHLEKFNLIEGKYIFSCAMIDERKNTITALQAFLDSDIPYKLVLAGSFRGSQEYNKKTKNIINSSKRIVHLGRISEPNVLDALYQGTAFHYLPSHFETPGLSHLEAISSGKTTIAGDCAPVREYFKDDVIFAKSKSKQSIIEALRSAYELQKDKKIELPDHLKWETITNQLHETYESL
ncbi:glycosyltransferase [compost metagenome]